MNNNTKPEESCLTKTRIIGGIVFAAATTLIIGLGVGLGLKPETAPETKAPSFLRAPAETTSPTNEPFTFVPTLTPSTGLPTKEPTAIPTLRPSENPTVSPTTLRPTTNRPTTGSPSSSPVRSPTRAPKTNRPTTRYPTRRPKTLFPTNPPFTLAPSTRKPSSSPNTPQPTTSSPTTPPNTASPSKTPATAHPASSPTILFIASTKYPLSSFNLDIALVTESLPSQSLPPNMMRALEALQLKFERIVVGDFPSTFNYSTRLACYGVEATRPKQDLIVDDLLIYIRPFNYSGYASAGPCYSSTSHTRVGLLDISLNVFLSWINNPSDLNMKYMRQTFEHEILHIFGIGTKWYNNNITSPNTNPTQYIGTNGVNAFRNFLGGTGFPQIENDFGTGSSYAHFDECLYNDETMTPVLNSDNYFSVLSCGTLADLNYTVDMQQCDTWRIPPVVPCTSEGYRAYLLRGDEYPFLDKHAHGDCAYQNGETLDDIPYSGGRPQVLPTCIGARTVACDDQ